MSDVGVIVSKHAHDRLVERDAELAKSGRNLLVLMWDETCRGIAYGRVSTREPHWTVRRQNGDRHSRQREENRSIRYVTNEDDTRCYVLAPARKRDPKFKRSWTVVTVLVRTDEERKAAA